ncbi:Transcription-repair-coupling factor [Candidatus Entotheonellaceae bacterium PAL068K]
MNPFIFNAVFRNPHSALSSHDTLPPRLAMRGVVAGAKGYVLARLLLEQRAPLLVVTPDARQRDLLYDDLRCFLADLSAVSASWSSLPEPVYRYTYHTPGVCGSVAYQQHRALWTYQPLWRLLGAEPVVVVTDVSSLRYRVMAPALLRRCLLGLRVGELWGLDDLVSTLLERGYRRTPLVEDVGEFSVRGGILDLFSPGQALPWRLEFFGDEVETIRTFGVESQTSIETLSDITIAPVHPLSRRRFDSATSAAGLRQHLRAQGWSPARIATYLEHWQAQHPAAWPWGLEAFFYETVRSPLAYLPEGGILCCVDAEDVSLTLQQLAVAVTMQLGNDAVPLPQDYCLAPDVLDQRLRQRTQMALVQYEASLPSTTTTILRTRGAPQFFGGIERFITQVRQWQTEGFCLLFLCRFALEAQRLQELLAECDLGSRRVSAASVCLSDATLVAGTILVGVGQISQGFVVPEVRLVVLRVEEIWGEKERPERSTPTRSRHMLHDVDTLQAGDRVVHVDYGIGIYHRMTFLDVGRDGGEFMELEYADGAKLYVPSHRLSVVQKYMSGEAEAGRLDRLGGSNWARTKERVKASLLAMAEDLVQLHAMRQTRPGYRFSPQTALHREFESGFEYAETEDQLRAIQQVTDDMEQSYAMERLVCGDVGYGKTEVAMRAIFKAVYDGKQVAVLVPTTVLAQQHHDTFQRRFAAYPVEIEVLSRMRRRREQQQVLDNLRAGGVDIVIGTHRLLQTDVRFKDLGLLVVDEEHRFGVEHKERIKQLSAHVDVLMLTATPIPRSLHMALVGLRHFSTMETAPEGRSAIQTLVIPFADDTIQQAIRQELARGGQVFFVHNHIDTLPAMQALLARLVPECRIGMAHGKMSERRLEKIMLQFLAREFDLLLCTTIIESGLDIPSVNTTIINRADRFGLGQLYQLRGRVGRSTQQAYAYLLIPGELLLSEVARKRLEAIEEFSTLGAGFHLATRDLEIRGAGNLLGAQQSGHIASIGFHLYSQMLEDAVHAIRGEEVPVRVDPELRLEVQGYIPQDYIASEKQRLALYQRLAAVADATTLADLVAELRDRFGPLPEAVQRLLAIVEIKTFACQLALERLEQRRDTAVLTFHPRTPVPPDQLLRWLQAAVPGFQFQSEQVVRLPLPTSTAEARLAWLKKHLQQLLLSGSL